MSKILRQLAAARNRSRFARSVSTEKKGAHLNGPKEEPKPSIFDRWEKSFDTKRLEMEKEAVARKRITAEQQAKADEFFNQKSLLETRKKLMEESLEGYFSAYYKVAKGKDKTMIATKLIPAKLARRMPPLDGTNLENNPVQISSLIHRKHATLVLITFNAFGAKHIESYLNPFYEKFQDEHAIKSPVVNLLAPYIRWRMDTDRRKRYIPVNKNLVGFRKAAGITNNAIGWATLVDGSGLIRWQGKFSIFIYLYT